MAIQAGQGIQEFGIFNVIHDTVIVKGAEGNTAKSKIVNTQLFMQTNKKDDFLQNAYFPLEDGQKFIAKAMAITTDLNEVLTPVQWHAFLENAFIRFTLNAKEYTKLPLWNYYCPLEPDVFPEKQSQFTRLDTPIVVDDKGSWKVMFETPVFETSVPIDETNGVQLGSGILDADNSPFKSLRVTFIGDYERP